MNTDSLRTFIKLSETMNYRKAAQQLFLAQSTVSARIQDLEKELGKKLFVFSGRTLHLTDAGKALRTYAEKMIKLEADIRRSICEIDESERTLRLGISDSILDWKVRDLISTYLEKHPNVAMEVHCQNSGIMMNELQNDNLDLCISFLPNRETSYQTQLLACEELLLITGNKRSVVATGISRDELLRQPLLMTDYFNVTQELDNWYQSLFPTNYVFKLRTSKVYEMKWYLKRMNGFAFLPAGFVKEELEKGELFSVPMLFPAPPGISMYSVAKKGSKKHALITSFLEELVI